LHKQVNQKSRRSFYMLLVCSHWYHPEFKETVSRDFVYIFYQTTFPVYNRNAKEGFRNLSKLFIFVFIFWSHRRWVQYTWKSITNTNNSRNIWYNFKSFLGTPNKNKRSSLIKKI
jgi:hypothetical protein